MTGYRILILLLAVVLSGCAPKETVESEPLPVIAAVEVPIVPFLTPTAWETSNRDWAIIDDALRFNVALPDALETRLLKEDRVIWKEVLTQYEQSQLSRRDASVLSKARIEDPVACFPPSSAFSLQQHSQLQLTLQLRRNILWRLGRLEMATRGVFNAVRNFLPLFSGGRIKQADAAVVQPIKQMALQVESFRRDQPIPKGEWMPGDLQFRMARTAHPAPIFLQAQTLLSEWNQQLASSERWQYLAESARPLIDALALWQEELRALVRAYDGIAINIRRLERDFAPPNALVAYPCINRNFKTLRIVSELYSHILPMQWALTQARNLATVVYARLQTADYASINHEFLSDEVARFIQQIDSQKAKLTRAEDLLLISWDETSRVIWQGLPEYIDPIHHQPKTAVESPETWMLMFKEIQSELAETAKLIAPEPEQPLNKRGKPYPPFISGVLEELHAPSRIDEAEQSLLAISELEAHMVAIRDELLRLCKQGACRSFPEAELANSPRSSAWVVSWRQSPSNERTLGHSLIVIKLCLLHLSRQVQRLSEIYAWFAETTNVDLTWKKLKSWQRIWTLYAEPNGTYASFLRNVASLDRSIADMAVMQKKRAESEVLHRILVVQDRFFDLTLDYARFLDARSVVPVSFDTLTETWDNLDQQLIAIEKVTLERDIQAHPELNTEKASKRRQQADIPR